MDELGQLINNLIERRQEHYENLLNIDASNEMQDYLEGCIKTLDTVIGQMQLIEVNNDALSS